jgi:hypothetical protein
MKKRIIVACGVVLAGATALAAQQFRHFDVRLDGFQEDPGAVITSGRGAFHARISNDGTSIAYELSYANLEGAITQAHIHIGTHSQSGGISVFLCTNLGNGPAGTQACPAAPATIEGVIEADDVLGPAGQGVPVGSLADLLTAIRKGAAYVNVHTSLVPTGEIRANLDHRQHGNGNGDGQGQNH